MRRRDFIAGSAAILGLSRSRPTWAQTRGNGERSAVVIGVDKVDKLPTLSAGRSAANDVATWLASEGFEVARLYEPTGVRAEDVSKTIRTICERGTCQLLVIYFSGHGFLQCPNGEFWLLTDAMNNPNEAISVRLSIQAAEAAGIPNVVFISDACRSTLDDAAGQQLHGHVIFPVARGLRFVGDVDVFYATLPGDPAIERKVDAATGTFHAVFTQCFLEAFRNPDKEMIVPVAGAPVIPNRKLVDYLAREVPRKAAIRNPTFRQIPHGRVPSKDDVYIGRFLNLNTTSLSSGPPWSLAPTAAASVLLEQAGIVPAEVRSPEALKTLYDLNFDIGVTQAKERVLASISIDSEGIETGFRMVGTTVAVPPVRPSPGFSIERITDNSSQAQTFRVKFAGGKKSGLQGLVFRDGSSAYLVLLAGFVANVLVENGTIANISYIPSRSGPYWDTFNRNKERIIDLHALTASLARFGLFSFSGPNEEKSKAVKSMLSTLDRLRIIDPTLALYCSYAFAEAGDGESLGALHSRLKEALGGSLFDLSLLRRVLNDKRETEHLSFVPMLTKGWLEPEEAKGVATETMRRMRPFVRPSLWTTFDERLGSLIANQPTQWPG